MNCRCGAPATYWLGWRVKGPVVLCGRCLRLYRRRERAGRARMPRCNVCGRPDVYARHFGYCALCWGVQQ